MSRVRRPLNYANLTATLALFLALGGTSYAALTITGKNVKNGSLTGKDIKNSSLTGSDVKNASLRARDFRAGELPAGARGRQGPQGPQGLQGLTGAAGTARAFATVRIDELGGYFLDPAKDRRNVVGVTTSTLGPEACVRLASSINASRVLPVASPEYSTSAHAGAFANAFFATDGCPPNSVAVVTGYVRLPDTLSGGDDLVNELRNEPFSVVVP